ncbi:MAG: rRNA maturation RNase YbeY [Bacteroidetes bacterium]|nr:rRNA maturation RNase YbeY [Bacteroidota bacterium]MCL2302732.1 rRNA maturation RNase YbeY [Lentimicrobiaceae bacterium]
MILFFSETKFNLSQKRSIKNWLGEIAKQESRKIGEINIVFYSDEQLLVLNKQYLNHDTFTDIITFDYSEEGYLNGDICISIERVKENANRFNCTFEEELRRVMAHGILHLCGYKDKKNTDKQVMKQKEENALVLFNTQYNYWKNKLL